MFPIAQMPSAVPALRHPPNLQTPRSSAPQVDFSRLPKHRHRVDTVAHRSLLDRGHHTLERCTDSPPPDIVRPVWLPAATSSPLPPSVPGGPLSSKAATATSRRAAPSSGSPWPGVCAASSSLASPYPAPGALSSFPPTLHRRVPLSPMLSSYSLFLRPHMWSAFHSRVGQFP